MLNNILKIMGILTMATMIGAMSWTVYTTKKMYKSMEED